AQQTFTTPGRSGGRRIVSATPVWKKFTAPGSPPSEWNIYAFHFSDGDNWGDDTPHCIEFLKEKLLPQVNLFGYGQVESPYGSGEFYDYVHEMLGEQENVVCSRIPDREAILGAMK